MNKKNYWTLVKGEYKTVSGSYVLGFISGYMDITCGIEGVWQLIPGVGAMVSTALCTEEQYEAFIGWTVKNFNGMCEFDYQIG